MCGIAGIFGNTGDQSMKDVVQAMAASLTHRGPSDDGVWVAADASIALGIAGLPFSTSQM